MSNPIKLRCLDDSSENMFIVSTNTRASTNASTGALVIHRGGLSINSTENAVNSSAGGALTVGGGASFGQDIKVGGGMTVGNVNITGQLYQNGETYVTSQWTSTSGNLTYTSGNVEVSNLTTGNINFTGSLYQNGQAYVGSQWTTTSGNLTYTSGNVEVSNLTTGNINFTGGLYQNGQAYVSSQWTSTAGNLSYTTGNVSITNLQTTNVSSGTVSASGVVSIGGKMYTNDISTNKKGVYFGMSDDGNHGVIYSESYNGPRLFGYDGGALGVVNGTDPLHWYNGGVSVRGGITVSGGNLTVTGNIGIGTTNPTSKLDVNGAFNAASATVPQLVATNVSAGSFVGSSASLSGNLVVGGDLTVNGTTTTVNTETTILEDNLLVLNSGPAGAADAGLLMKRFVSGTNGTYNYACMFYKETTDEMTFALTNSDPGANPVTIDSYLPIRAESATLNGALSATSATVPQLVATNITVGSFVGNNFSTTNFTASNFIGNNFSAGNLVASALNLGVSSVFSGSFAASNNVSSATNVSGLSFDSSITSFSCNLMVNIVATTNLYENFTLSGNKTNSGWNLYVSSIGDTSGINFTITSGGQVQYTSTNVSGFASSTFRYSCTQISESGTYTAVNPSTSGTYIYSTLQVSGTQSAVSGSNNGSLYVQGGATLDKNLIVGTSLSAASATLPQLVATNVSSGAFVGSSASLSGALSASGNSNTIGNLFTTGGNVGIGTSSPSYKLDVNGDLRANGMVSSNNFSRNFDNRTLAPNSIAAGTFSVGFGSYANNNFGNWADIIALNTWADGSGENQNAIFIRKNGIGMRIYQGAFGSASAFSDYREVVLANSSGNVGIGTDSPSYKLDVNGDLRYNGTLIGRSGSSLSGWFLNYIDPTLSGMSMLFGRENSNKNSAEIGFQYVGSGSDSNRMTFGFYSHPNLMNLTAAGNFGIGTTSPSEKLHINGNILLGPSTEDSNVVYSIATPGQLLIHANNASSQETTYVNLDLKAGISPNQSGIEIYGSSADSYKYIAFSTANTERMRVSSSGNVGIGTISPSYKLDVSGGESKFESRIYLKDAYSSNRVVFGHLSNEGAGDFHLYDLSNDRAILSYFNSGKLNLLQNGGNVGVGTTNPQFTLDVNGTLEGSNANGVFLFASSGNVGIGTTAPQLKLDVNGRVRLMANGENSIASATGGSYMYINSVATSNTGGYSRIGSWNSNSAAQNLILQDAGGNVGISTSAPEQRLHVSGGNIYISAGAGTFPVYQVMTGATNGGSMMWNDTNRSLDLQTINVGSPIGIRGSGVHLIPSGNVGVGTTTPVFKFDVVGAIRCNSHLVSATAGSSSDYTSFAMQNNNGYAVMFLNSSTRTSDGGVNTLTLRNDIGALRLAASGGGDQFCLNTNANIGIGTSSPATKLQVNGTGLGLPATTGSTMSSGSILRLKGNDNATLDIGSNSASGMWLQSTDVIGLNLSYPLLLNPNGGNVCIGSGNIGIGDNNPRAKIHATGDLYLGQFSKIWARSSSYAHAGLLELQAGWVDADLINPTSLLSKVQIYGYSDDSNLLGSIRFSTYGSERMCINYLGNVGIGTTAPNFKLDTVGTVRARASASSSIGMELMHDGTNGTVLSYNRAGSYTRLTVQGLNPHLYDGDTMMTRCTSGIFNIVTGQLQLGDFNSNAFHMQNFGSGLYGYGGTWNAGSARFCSDSRGNFGIGTHVPGYPLTVLGSANSGSLPGYAAWYGLYGWQNQTTSYNVSIYGQNFIMAGQGFVSISDSRIKKEVSDIPDQEALDLIRLIEPKKYKYVDECKRGTEPVYGFIAQQVRSVLNYATSVGTDFIPNVLTPGSLDYDEENDTTTVTLVDNKEHTFTQEQIGSRVRVFDSEEKQSEYVLHSIVSSNAFKVSGKIEGESTFVYGIEVNDFHSLNKDAIFTVAVAALQEVDRQLQAEKQAHQETKQRLDALEAFLQSKFPGEI